jgi:hypothetical protein
MHLGVPVITNEVYVGILVMRKQGICLRKIGEEMGYTVNTVRNHLASVAKPIYDHGVVRVTSLAPYHHDLCDCQLVVHANNHCPFQQLLAEFVPLTP